MKRFWTVVGNSILFIAIALIVYFLARYAADNELVRSFAEQYGYLGIFGVSIFSGFNIVVPIPVSAFMPLFFSLGLNIIFVILVIAVGLTVADGVTYVLGLLGRRIVSPNSKILKRLYMFRDKNKYMPLIVLALFASFAPLPNEVLIIPMAFMGYRARHVIPIVFVGNIIFNSITAFGILAVVSLI